MINDYELQISNRSYTRKDFAQIYPELLSLAKTLTNRYNECEDTELFIYPQDESYIEPLNRIWNSGKVWEPDMSEFRNSGLHSSDGRNVVHYHNSLVPINERVEMTYRPDEVSFDQLSWHKLGEGEEWGAEWEFSLAEIRTPYGDFDIEGFMEVEQNG